MAEYKFMSPEVQYYIEVQQHQIPGWLYLVSCFMIPILDQVQKNQGIKGDICEIGVFEGKTLALLGLLARPGEICVGLDIEVRENLQANLRNIFPDKYPFLVEKRDSLELDAGSVLQFSHSGGYRFFHVDGYHTFENALNDLQLAAATLSPGGIIFLDDFYSPTVPGVTEAFHHLVEKNLNHGVLPFAMGGAKAYLCHEEYIELYRTALFENMPMPSKSHPQVGVLFGKPIAIYDLYPSHIEVQGSKSNNVTVSDSVEAPKVSLRKLERVQGKLKLKEDKIKLLQKELREAKNGIEAMKSSKFWKLREIYMNLKKKLPFST